MKQALAPLRRWIYDLFPGSQCAKKFHVNKVAEKQQQVKQKH